MEPENHKTKNGIINEEDVCYLLQRYPATTILTLLREVAQYQGVNKFNWNLVLSRVSNLTGIKTPRELQLLWRHIAYRHPLSAHHPSDQPLDDDSDLEYEVEVFPSMTTEATTEAVNCVKVLAYGSANESGVPSSSTVPNSSNVDGDMPNGHLKSSANGHLKSSAENPHAASLLPNSNGPHPVSGQTEGLDANGLANNSRKKRKWSEEEDLKLIAGVQKWGEGNWAAMLKEDGDWGRTAGQLSQRWGNMKKKQGNLNAGAAGSIGVQLSEAQLATRRALSMALKDNAVTAAGSNNPAKPSTSNGESPVSSVTVPSLKQPAQITKVSVKPAPASSLPRPRPPPKKAAAKPPSVSDPIQRAAVAAGARIAGTSAAVALHEQVVKSMFPNVHYIRTGLAGTAASVAAGTSSPANGGQQAKGNTGKPSVPSTVASHLPRARSMPAVASEQSTVSSCSSANELKKQEDKIRPELIVGGSGREAMAVVQENSTPLKDPSKALPGKGGAASPGATVGGEQQAASVGISQHATSKVVALKEPKDDTSKQVTVNPVPMDVCENSSAVQESCTPNVNGRPSAAVDSTEKMEVSSEV